MAIEMGDGFKQIYGAGEATATLLTGMAASVPAGLYGLSSLIAGKLGLTDDDAFSAATSIETMIQKGTYTPSTAEGQQLLQGTIGILEKAGVPANKVGEVLGAAAKYLGATPEVEAGTQTAGEIVGDPLNLFPFLKGAALAGMMVPGKYIMNSADIIKASHLAKQGMDPKEIWKHTGLYKDKTGQWIGVLSDQRSKLTNKVRTYDDGSVGMIDPEMTLGDLIEHPDLFRTFPELKDIKVRRGSWTAGGGQTGSYNPVDNSITVSAIAKDTTSFHSNLLHEIQHAVQERTGMPQGANIQMFYPKHITYLDDKLSKTAIARNNLDDQLRKSGKIDPVGRILDEFDDDPDVVQLKSMDIQLRNMNRIRQDAYTSYKKVIGEEQSRATQKMWEQQVYKDFPPDYMDTPIDQQILSPRGGTVQRLDHDTFIKQFPEFQYSKISDEHGRLMPVYHGTIDEVKGAFRYSGEQTGQLGLHFGTLDAATDRARGRSVFRNAVEPEKGAAAENIHQVYLNIRNPIRLYDEGHWGADVVVNQLRRRMDLSKRQEAIIQQFQNDNPDWRNSIGGPPDSKVRKLLDDLGYDGVVYANKYEGFDQADSYIALNPNQVRSAISGASK